jgi:hypothetical protein
VPAPDIGGSAILDAYLAKLDAALATLPADERREILLETKSHVVERARRNPASLNAVLAELGEPDSYARQFLAEESAGEPAQPSGALAGVARLATGGWKSLPLLFVVAGAYSVAVLRVLLALGKILEPNATGLFVSDGRAWRGVEFAISDPRHGGRDVLGYWFVAITLAIAALIHFVVSAFLKRLFRQPSRRP